ncbi:MAG TPA: PQQ-binding-like beta-propeller repeat protein [Bryobacteraceae bacterium]|nr:PQQ-binding-like beta-propeller repeat protein [Bryobacteraceae bacterium]
MLSRRSFFAFPGFLPFVDWPQWRGPNRDGSVALELPKAWPERMRQVWNLPVGEGHASPVVVGNRVFQFSRVRDQETIAAYDVDSGKQLWKQSYAAPYEMNSAATSHGKGPKSTPVVAGSRVFTLGISGIVTGWDAASGKKLWSTAAKGSPDFGHASSPVVDGDTLIGAVGPQSGGTLSAFEAATGKVKWQWKEDGPAYASPIVIMAGGVKQVVTNSQSHLIGVSLADGKTLWKLPLKTNYDQNSVTPLVVGDVVIFSGLGNPVTAVRPGSQPQKLWENKEFGMYMNSPVLAAGVVWGLSHRNKGQFFGIDPKTGKTVWTSEGRQTENAAMVASGNAVFALTTESELIVYAASAKGLTQVRRYHVADTPTWAHPVVLGNRVLVKDANSLILWSAA